jgi:surface carbohydrate biosynthesis protein
MQPVDILYFIEHKARELDIACAVKYLIENRHPLSVEIRSIVLDLEKTLTQFSPRLIVLPFCVSINSLNLEKIVSRWPAARYVNLSYEQLLGEAQKKFKAPADDFARNCVLHHAWGDFFREFLLDSGVPEQNIVVNGNPSYALYQEPYKRFYGDVRNELAQKFELNPGKRWVFVPENYGWAFFENHMLRDRIKRGFDSEHAYIYRDFSVDSLRTAAEWWCAGALLDEVELIIRPRPAVPRDIFQEKIEGMVGDLPDQLHIIKDGSAREWILASDVIFSSYSTTLLEAAAAQKPFYMLVPYPFPEFIHVDWNDLADQVKTVDQFLSILTQPSLDHNWTTLEAWVKETMLSQGDPIARQAGILVSVVNKEIDVPDPGTVVEKLRQSGFEKAVRAVRKFGWKSLQKSLQLLGIQTQAQRWNPHEADLVQVGDVSSRIIRWQEVLR